MPNTLAHIGLQAPLTKLGLQTAPLQWIALGCIIPDIPWILQRILELSPATDLVSLRLYAIFQASLFSCCVLSLAFALLTRKTGFIFLILSTNSLAHLLLDACQTKWGNGVNLLLPFSWHSTNFAFFWPETPLSYLLTAIGVVALIFYWPKAIKDTLFLQKPNSIKTITIICALVCYIMAPFFFIHTAYDADMHYSKTILNKEERTGKTVEIDRGEYNRQQQTIASYADKALHLNNPPATESQTLSLRGVFTENNNITITNYHEHKKHRDYASYAGLFFTLILWLRGIMQMQKNRLSIDDTNNPTNHVQKK